VNVRPDLPTTMDAFERWVQRQEGKYEWDGKRGCVVMMTGVSRSHTRITGNVVRLLQSALPPEDWDVSIEAFGVEAEESLRYPDVMVEPRDPRPGTTRRAAAPVLIVEILSPSTAYLDVNEKPNEYLTLPTLDTYLVLAQDDRLALVWRRRPDGTFPARPEEIDDPQAVIAVPALGLELPFDEIYRAVF
jgi:Uma2 family endonuclease